MPYVTPDLIERDQASDLVWWSSSALIDYGAAVATMEQRVADIAAGKALETLWLLEHPPLYSAGTSAKHEDLLDRQRFPVHRTGRGGQYTYHGPGQRIVYVMLDVRRRAEGDIRAFVSALEGWMIDALAQFNVSGQTFQDRVGVWVVDGAPGAPQDAAKKIASIGIRLRGGISYHGMALNVSPDLSHFDGIVPCGLAGAGVTSLEALGVEAAIADADRALKAAFRGSRLYKPGDMSISSRERA